MLEAPADAEVQAHLRGCESCRELADDDAALARALSSLSQPVASGAGFDDLLNSMQAEDRSTLGTLRAMPTSRRLAIAFGAVIIGGLVFFLTGKRPDWDIYPMGRMLVVTIAMLVAAGFGVVLALPKIYKPRRSATFRLGLFAFLLLVPFVPALLPMAHEAHAGSDGNFWLTAGKCFGLGAVLSAPALLVVRALQRDDEIDTWAAMFGALAAALGGNVALQIHCPAVGQGHLVFGHAALAVVYAVLAWIVVRR